MDVITFKLEVNYSTPHAQGKGDAPFIWGLLTGYTGFSVLEAI